MHKSFRSTARINRNSAAPKEPLSFILFFSALTDKLGILSCLLIIISI